MWLPGQLSALGSWPKASRPHVMVQPATVGINKLYLKSGSEGGYISSCDFGRLNKVLGKGACGMKKYLVQKKEELIVDLNLSTCCANICLVALIILFNAKEKLLSLPAASGPV